MQYIKVDVLYIKVEVVEIHVIKVEKQVFKVVVVGKQVEVLNIKVKVEAGAKDRCDPPCRHQVPRGCDSWRKSMVSCFCDSSECGEREESGAACERRREGDFPPLRGSETC